MSYIPILYLNNQQLQKIIEVGGQWRDTLQIDEDNMSWAMKAKAAKKGPACWFVWSCHRAEWVAGVVCFCGGGNSEGKPSLPEIEVCLFWVGF